MVRAKKSLGQNFLKAEFARQIVNSCQIKDKNILEIGPGHGAITNLIMQQQPKKFVAIELDDTLADSWAAKQDSVFSLIHANALNIDMADIFGGEKFSVIANLPYNVSTQILMKLLRCCDLIESMTLMFQKEVAERIIAPSGGKKFGRISVITQKTSEPRSLFIFGPECFSPAPKIDSQVLRFIPKQQLPDDEFSKFELFNQQLFAMRRKTIKNNLKSFANIDSRLAKLSIDPGLRPENLTVDQIYNLFSLLIYN